MSHKKASLSRKRKVHHDSSLPPTEKYRGWVYVVTNHAMPGLVKVGRSSKDPEFRALELGGTGNPHQYDVAYDALVTDPIEIEKLVHKKLQEHNEAKEWFRCDVEEAVAAIREVAYGEILLEAFKKTEKELVVKRQEEVEKKLNAERQGRAEAAKRVFEKELAEKKAAQELAASHASRKEENSRIRTERTKIEKEFQDSLKRRFESPYYYSVFSYPLIWLMTGGMLQVYVPGLPKNLAIGISFLLPLVISYIIFRFVLWHQPQTKEYKELVTRKNTQLDALPTPWGFCPSCHHEGRLPRWGIAEAKCCRCGNTFKPSL